MAAGQHLMSEGSNDELSKLLVEALRIADAQGRDIVALYIVGALDSLAPKSR